MKLAKAYIIIIIIILIKNKIKKIIIDENKKSINVKVLPV